MKIIKLLALGILLLSNGLAESQTYNMVIKGGS